MHINATTTPRQWATLPQLRERYQLLKDRHARTIKRLEDAGRFPRRRYLNPVTPVWALDECDAWASDPINYVREDGQGL